MGCLVEGLEVEKGRYLGGSDRKTNGNIEVGQRKGVNQVETHNSI